MLVQKKTFEDFYREIRDQFPALKELTLWTLYDLSQHSSDHSFIVTECADEMMTWLSAGHATETQRLMCFIERYFQDGDLAVVSILYSDFLVAIIGAKKETREAIKNMMEPETEKRYKNLLRLYRELDT